MTSEPAGLPDEPPHSPHGEEEMVCYCFHVPLHKIENFIRRERPAKVSMISHCLGAGTGCGTCVYDLKVIYKRVMAECAAEDAKKGVVTAAGTPAAPFAPLPKITGRQPVNGQRLHSPETDLGPVQAPVPVATPFEAPPPAPPAPAYPVSAESTPIELEEEPDDAGPEDTP